MRRMFVMVMAVSAIAGCEPQIDNKKAEGAITDELKKKDMPPKSVTCPAGVKIKKDDEFKCKVKFEDDQEAEVNVKQTDDKGNVEWKLASVISVKALEENLASKNKDTKFTCPGKVILIKKDASLVCKAKTGDDESSVDVKFTDDEGNFTVKSKE